MKTHNTQKRLNVYCQLMIVLLTLITVRLWMMPVDLLPRAEAQFGDAGAQRLKLVKSAEKTNALLSEIRDTLKGTVKVQIEGEKSDAKAGRKSDRKKP